MRVLCLGELVIDFIAPLPGSLEEASHYTRCVGGSAGNIAAGLRAAGIDVTLCSRVGRDLWGKLIIHELQRLGLSTEHVTVDDARPTRCAFISHDEAGNRFIEIVNRNSADQHMTVADVRLPLEAPFTLLHISGVMLISEPGFEMVQYSIEAARPQEAVISFDPVFDIGRARDIIKTRINEVLAHADIVKLNDSEFKAVADRVNQKNIRPHLVLHTRGAEGAVLSTATRSVRIPAWPANAIDPTGAGDAFFAAFLAAFLNESGAGQDPSLVSSDSMERWGREAARQAARAIQQVGALTLYQERQDEPL